jgi:hypothetical protein
VSLSPSTPPPVLVKPPSQDFTPASVAPSALNFSTPTKGIKAAPKSSVPPSNASAVSTVPAPSLSVTCKSVILPMDPLSVSMRNQYPPVMPLCKFCNIYPADNTYKRNVIERSCIPCLFRLLPRDYDDSMKTYYGISRRESRLLERYEEEFNKTHGHTDEDGNYDVFLFHKSDRKSIWIPSAVRYRKLFHDTYDDASDVWMDFIEPPSPSEADSS